MQKHIVVITGSRAEWGLLQPVCRELLDRGARVTVLVTGSHLHSQSGFSGSEVDSCFAFASEKVCITPENGSLNSHHLMMQTMSNAFALLPATLEKLQPDLALVLGDRYEIFAAATVCRLSGIRLAHISGGELTTGAFDDCLRHCITKLSDLHFTAAQAFKNRVIQLGESPDRVFNVGELALADLHKTRFKSRQELEQLVKTDLESFFLITVHPETCAPGQGMQIFTLLDEIFTSGFAGFSLIFTAANADPEGDQINAAINVFVERRANGRFIKSLGRLNYLSMARLATCVIGNSSSGIAEVPALGTPVVNIGRRQHGRPHGSSVISVAAEKDAIVAAIKKASQPTFREQSKNCCADYEGHDSARRIAEIIVNFDLGTISREKGFVDLP